jgi:hypothetical protein
LFVFLKGFQIKIDEQTHSIKISQLADDTTLYFNSKNDISAAMNEIEIFGNFSGLMINRNKTEGLWIGKLKHSKDKEEHIKWTNKPIKTLAIYYGHDYPPFSKSPINVFLFTLSGFPFHINSKHLLSISFLYFSGITHELTIKEKLV